METLFIKHKFSFAYVFNLLVLSLICALAQGQEQYKPDLKPTFRDFTLTLPMNKRAQKLRVEVKDNLVIYEGDMILGPLVSFEGDNAVAIDGGSYRWPNATIPYVISSGHPKKTDIEWAINHINQNTNLCLVARTNQTDYIQFISGSGCASYVGKQGGRQDITIGNCPKGSIAHEICHAAGLFHEQSREDRDSYITINFGNITAGKEHNFNKHVSDGIDIGSYDYGSIMHYGATAFSKNGNPTIVVKVPPGTSSTVIGQRDGLSTKDKNALNSMYQPGPCKGVTCNTEDCASFNPNNLTAKQSGATWTILDGSHSLFSAPNKAEADKLIATIKHYGFNKSCYVGRPGPSFEYLLVNNGPSTKPALSGEDCLPFNPNNLEVKKIGGSFKIVEGNKLLFDFGNSKAEADLTLCLIKKHKFTKTCYVGRPDASLTYLKK